MISVVALLLAMVTPAGAQSGGTPPPEACTPRIDLVGSKAVVPKCAPLTIRRAVRAANRIRHKPYVWGGGHGFGRQPGFDCSGAVSYVLRGAKLLSVPRTSVTFRTWGSAGRGKWITVFANFGHAYMEIGGKRFDTSGGGPSGPRWRGEDRPSVGFAKRRAKGL